METVPLAHVIPVNQDWAIRIDPSQQQQTQMTYQTRDTAREFEYVEISDQGRQLAQEDVVHQTARYFFSTDIEDALSTALNEVPEQVSDAAYRIIDENFMSTGAMNDEQRQVALEMGLSQANYLAENYLNSEQRATFMAAMQRIAVISTTRSTDENGTVSYASSPERVPGSDEYKTDWLAVMQEKAPEQYATFQAEMENGGNGLSTLLGFVTRTLEHPGWAKAYQRTAAEQESMLANKQIENRFATVNRSSADAYMTDVNDILDQTVDSTLAQTYSLQLARFLSALATVNDSR